MAHSTNILTFISQGKGFPKWFKEEYILTYIGLHDLCKSIDYITHLCKKVFDEEGMKEVVRLREDFNKALSQLGNLEIILHRACKNNEIPEFTKEDLSVICKIIEDNQEILKNEILNTNGEPHI